jgi:hypothetical protein
MKRMLLITIAIWVLLLSPGLCLAGTLEHFCADSSHNESCAHEDDCSNDPCSGEVLRPDATTNLFVIAVDAALVSNRLDTGTDLREAFSFLDTLFIPDRTNIPVPDSDLPLLS